MPIGEKNPLKILSIRNSAVISPAPENRNSNIGLATQPVDNKGPIRRQAVAVKVELLSPKPALASADPVPDGYFRIEELGSAPPSSSPAPTNTWEETGREADKRLAIEVVGILTEIPELRTQATALTAEGLSGRYGKVEIHSLYEAEASSGVRGQSLLPSPNQQRNQLAIGEPNTNSRLIEFSGSLKEIVSKGPVTYDYIEVLEGKVVNHTVSNLTPDDLKQAA